MILFILKVLGALFVISLFTDSSDDDNNHKQLGA